MSEGEAATLIRDRYVGPLEGFRNSFGQEFAAGLELTPDLKVRFQFVKTEVQEKQAEALEDKSNIICPCPVCKPAGKDNMIYDTETAYICEAAIRGDADGCKPKGKLSKVMCQFPLDRTQALKYFTEGKTDLIDKFVSKKNRPFTARLVCNTEGKMMLGWDFPEREPKLDAEGKPIPPRRRAGPPRHDFTAKKAPAKKTAKRK